MKANFALATFGIFLFLQTTCSKKLFSNPPNPRMNKNCECGKSGEEISNRIVGGVITLSNIYPWVVAIFYKKSLHCGGSLINDRYVLTAGHCVKWTDHDLLEVGLGMHDIQNHRAGYIVPIDRVILHKDFESDYLHDTNDIALMRLKNPVKYSDTVSPVCLPAKGSDYTGDNVIVTGWGRIVSNGEASRYLKKANLRIMPWSTCTNTSFGDHLTESMMCAYADRTDACQGDSGGPVLYKRHNSRYETIGIVSWGIGCAKPDTPGVYVKNSDYLNWIKAHTTDGIYCMDRS